MRKGPFLLYLTDKANPLDIKIARGIATFRRSDCVGEWGAPGATLALGLPRIAPDEAFRRGARAMIIDGSANRLDNATVAVIIEALEAGIDIVSGRHEHLNCVPEIRARAIALGRKLHDFHRAPTRLRVGTGAKRPGRRLLTVGTDCSVGKMFTSLHLVNDMKARGIAARFRATGVAGRIIAEDGIVIESVPGEFISGAAEALSPACDDASWDIVEGQGSIFNPSCSAVALGLLHGTQPSAIVLCHDPSRPHLRGAPHLPLPALGQCLAETLDCARITNPDVVALGLSLDCSRLSPGETQRALAAASDATGLPCVAPALTGIGALLDALEARFNMGNVAAAQHP